MAEIVARFADGRLLVQEDRVVTKDYTSGTGTPIRIGLLKTVEKIISLDSYISGYSADKVGAPIAEATVSGDTILVRLRRTDLPLISGMISGSPWVAGSILSNITSGLVLGEELASGLPISGKLNVLANVIGF